jgi:D-beta-D-heptose 7-phosphate kinase/D-beta-D-heptose 1-phosphate adenosyltransferase
MKKILVIGDTIIDETYYVTVSKISPEAPVPVASIIEKDTYKTPGGASLAVSYAKKNKIPCKLLTCSNVENLLTDIGLDVSAIKPNMEPIVKKRFIDKQSNYHLLRVDNDCITNQKKILQSDIEKHIDKILNTEDIGCIALLDYRKAMLLYDMTCWYIIDKAKQRNIPVYADSRGNIYNFANCNTLKLNEKEYEDALTKHNFKNMKDLATTLNIKEIIVTYGKKGARLYSKETDQRLETTAPISLYSGTPDVTGCGDVFDINFCYYRFIQEESDFYSLKVAVTNATKYAYEPIGDRLW